uniref:Uncharacterized protein n=1 Tax=Physcomitrium patens TaxID=3218 RepID=A0A2K1KWT8_PHYPA|nr:hypothetical protein PHYPA_005238 [Physcomitrium patens]
MPFTGHLRPKSTLRFLSRRFFPPAHTCYSSVAGTGRTRNREAGCGNSKPRTASSEPRICFVTLHTSEGMKWVQATIKTRILPS